MILVLADLALASDLVAPAGVELVRYGWDDIGEASAVVFTSLLGPFAGRREAARELEESLAHLEVLNGPSRIHKGNPLRTYRGAWEPAEIAAQARCPLILRYEEGSGTYDSPVLRTEEDVREALGILLLRARQQSHITALHVPEAIGGGLSISSCLVCRGEVRRLPGLAFDCWTGAYTQEPITGAAPGPALASLAEQAGLDLGIIEYVGADGGVVPWRYDDSPPAVMRALALHLS